MGSNPPPKICRGSVSTTAGIRLNPYSRFPCLQPVPPSAISAQPTKTPADQTCASAKESVFSSPVSPASHTLRSSRSGSLACPGLVCASARCSSNRKDRVRNPSAMERPQSSPAPFYRPPDCPNQDSRKQKPSFPGILGRLKWSNFFGSGIERITARPACGDKRLQKQNGNQGEVDRTHADSDSKALSYQHGLTPSFQSGFYRCAARTGRMRNLPSGVSNSAQCPGPTCPESTSSGDQAHATTSDRVQ
jgi:hypothetical protein